MGPPKRVLSKNAQGEDMNMVEKPDYLASNFFSWFAKRGQWLIVAGFGAGGDVRGAVDAGMNVVAFEADTQQYLVTIADMRTFVLKDDLIMLVTTELLSKAQKAEALGLGRSLVGVSAPCRGCGGGGDSGQSSDCKLCGNMGCGSCFTGTPSWCHPCRAEMEANVANASLSGSVPALGAAGAEVAGEAAAAGEFDQA